MDNRPYTSLTVPASEELRVVRFLTREPDASVLCADTGVIELCFDEWSRPAAEHFLVPLEPAPPSRPRNGLRRPAGDPKLPYVPFIGWHAACRGEFGPGLFCCDGRDFASVPSLAEGGRPAVELGADGRFPKEKLREARAYACLERRANAAILAAAIPGTACPVPEDPAGGTRDPFREILDVLERLVEWEAGTGGFEAQVWEEARCLMAKLRGKGENPGLFGGEVP